MARVNIYLTDDLANRAREAGLNVSGIAQEALERELRVRAMNEWLDSLADLHAQLADRPPISDKVMQEVWDEVDEEAGRAADRIVEPEKYAADLRRLDEGR